MDWPATESQSFSELDVNKINKLYNASLWSSEFGASTSIYNTALGLKASQLLEIYIQQSGNSTINHLTTFTFNISTSINSKPTSANLRAYAKADNFESNITTSTADNGRCNLSIEIPETATNTSFLIIFARAPIDSRLTSFAIYNINNATQESTPNDGILNIEGPINNRLTWNSNDSSLQIEKAEIFSFGYAQNVSVAQGTSYCMLPNLVDSSPQIIILNGHSNGSYFQTWTANPRIPFEIGSDFNQSEQNVFAYLITIKENLYKVEISFGDLQL